MTREIRVDHLARVEGHGGITVVLDGAEVASVRFDVFEGIRLFEGLVCGHDHVEVPALVSRICAICSHGHALTALAALEDALGIHISAQTRALRDLAYQGESIESHALHVFCLALPDFLGHPSVVSLAGAAPDAVACALRLKKVGNLVQEVVGGRAVHPVNYVPGGFGRLPTEAELHELARALAAALADCEQALAVARGVAVPRFLEEPLQCAALVPDDDAFFFGARIRVSGGVDIPVAAYRKLTGEYPVPHSHAKHSALFGQPYLVGALARLTLNGDRLDTPLARRAWAELHLEIPSTNVLANNLAQLVELVYSVEHAHALVAGLLRDGLRPEAPPAYRVRAGSGTAASEVPRGILFHSYELDGRGRVAAADVITPTAQNLNHAESQLRAAVRASPGISDDQLRHRLEMVARAYDPCISCSVHVVRAG